MPSIEFKRIRSFRDLVTELETLFVEGANLAEIPYYRRENITAIYRSAYENKQKTNVGYDVSVLQSRINALTLPYEITNTADGVYKVILKTSHNTSDYPILFSNLLHYLANLHRAYDSNIKIMRGAVSRLYNHTFGRFYPYEDLDHVYSVDDINQMLYHRRIPYRFRCFKDKEGHDVCTVKMIRL